MVDIANWQIYRQQIANWMVTIGSLVICAMLLPIRLPGMALLDHGPNWLLIWVVAWSIKRTMLQGAIAGLAVGLIQDGMTAPYPSHAIALACVGILSARIKKQRYIQEDFISVALIVFGMAVVAETVMAIQFGIMGDRKLAAIWTDYQRIALASAILSSLWAPVVYYPLNLWWRRMNLQEH